MRQLLKGVQEGFVRSVRRALHADFTDPIRAESPHEGWCSIGQLIRRAIGRFVRTQRS